MYPPPPPQATFRDSSPAKRATASRSYVPLYLLVTCPLIIEEQRAHFPRLSVFCSSLPVHTCVDARVGTPSHTARFPHFLTYI